MINKCRTCGEVTRPIYAKYLYDDEKEILLHQIEVLTGLWLGYNESIPSSICAYCVQDLKQAVRFRERCINVQEKLHQKFKNEFEMKKTISKLSRGGTNQIISKNDSTSKIINQDEFCESNLQIMRFESDSNFKCSALNKRQDSQIENKENSKTEDYEIDPLIIDNSNESEKSEKIDMDSEPYCAYEEIQDRIDVEEEYDRNLHDCAGNLLKNKADNKVKTSDKGGLEGSVGLSEEELQSRLLEPKRFETETNNYVPVSLAQEKSIRKCRLQNRKVLKEGKQNAPFEEEQLYTNEENIIEQQESDKDKEPESDVENFDVLTDLGSGTRPVKMKRKYTFNARKPASAEKRKYKPTRSEYVCEICGKSYSKLFSFSEHKLQHTGVKGFKCTECPKEFFNNRLLKQHIIKHTDERPFVCRICSLTFRSRAHRNDHEKRHMNPQPWLCGYCGKKLTTSTARDLHEAAHRGVRKHHCDTCDRGFITRKHLMSHKKTKLHKQNLEREKEETPELHTELLE